MIQSQTNMKKHWFLIIGIFIGTGIHAQTVNPVTQQPTLATVKKADLQITGFQVLSKFVKDSSKVLVMKVKVTIKNNGQTDAGVSLVGASFQNNVPGSAWQNFGTPSNFPQVKAGQTISYDCTFRILIGLIKTKLFNFRLKADASNLVAELNEDNNSSTGILIGL
jgi:hypothetical protein